MGWGTPNILSADEFKRIVRHLDFWFDLDRGLSHSIELDPRHLTAELAETYAAVGVTRASLGVQDLNAHVQQAIGRVQPFEIVRQAVADLRHAGIQQFGFDLMYGLPTQSTEELLNWIIRLAATLAPDRSRSSATRTFRGSNAGQRPRSTKRRSQTLKRD